MNGCEADCIAEAARRRKNEAAMKPPENSLTAGELAAIARLRQQPSWRATKGINGAPPSG